MIRFVRGDLFADMPEAVVNTVNCVGVMGRGVALQFKKRFPANFKAYKSACDKLEVLPGRMFVFETESFLAPKWIINFPTKRNWKGASKLEDIESGLDDLVSVIRHNGIREISLPPLGCGLGGLDWNVVKPLIIRKLTGIAADVDVRVHEPLDVPIAVRNVVVPAMSRTIASIIVLSRRYLDAMLDPCITLVEIQKLMYFMQESGEDLKLDFIRYHYGPYARNLRFVLRNLEGHYMIGYGDGGEQPDKFLRILPGAFEDAMRYLSGYPDTLKRIDQVMGLVHGYETPDSMELMATVHWLMRKDKVRDLDELLEHVHAWSSKKRRFSVWQIEKVQKALLDGRWVLA